MESRFKLVLASLFTVAMIASAQSSTNDAGLVQETQAREYWTDPSAGLMWASKDNGKDLRWSQAMKYCGKLRLAGYSDWRLATIDELQEIYDRSAAAPGENPRSRWHEAKAMTFHVKGNLFLTGDQWTSSRVIDDRGHPSGYAWRFNFNEGRRDTDPIAYIYGSVERALCVRRLGR